MTKNRLLIAGILLSFLVVSVIADIYYYNKVSLPPEDGPWQIAYSDFRVFWTTANDFYLRYANDPAYGPIDRRYAAIYDFKKEFYHFRYSPLVAFAFVPLSRLPMGLALLVWSVILNLSFAATILILVYAFSSKGGLNAGKKIAASAIAMVLAAVFYLNNLALGQTDIFVTFLLAMFLLAYCRGRDIPAAIAFSLVLQFKPFFLPALIYLFLSGRRRIVLYTGIALIVSLAIPMVIPGYAREIFYINGEWVKMIFGSVQSQLSNPKNQSLTYMLLNSLGVAGWKIFVYKISAVFYIIAISGLLWIKRRSRAGTDPDFCGFEISVLILISLLFSPLIWKASFVYSVIPVMFALFLRMRRDTGGKDYVFLGLYFILTSALGSDITKKIPVQWLSAFKPLAAGTVILLVYIAVHYLSGHRRADS